MLHYYSTRWIFQENLVFEKHTGSLTGFINLGDPEINFLSVGKTIINLEKYVLVFMLRGITTEWKHSFAYFARNNITAGQLLPLFWDAVGLL